MKLKRFENILNEANIPKTLLTDWTKRIGVLADAFEDGSDVILSEMLLYLKKLLPKNGDKIDFTEEGFADDSEAVVYDDAEIIIIYNSNGAIYFETDTTDNLKFKYLGVHFAIELMHLIKYLYEYQINIIKKEPERIKDILPYLHPALKKEYPHLLTGTDLNLL